MPQHRPKQKIFVIILFFCIFYFLFSVSFLSISPRITFPSRYFTPIFGLSIILVAEVINLALPKKTILQVIKLTVVLLFLYASSPNLTDYLARGIKNIWNSSFTLYKSSLSAFQQFPYTSSPESDQYRSISSLSKTYNPIIEAVKNEVIAIRKDKNINNYLFFHIKSYYSGYEDRYADSIFWVVLEKDFNEKLTRVNDDAYRDYEPVGEDLYIFLWCQQDKNIHMNENEKCVTPFLRDHPAYELIKRVEEYPIYVTKKYSKKED